MAGLNLYFLGPPRVEQDDDQVELSASKAVALLAYLAVTGAQHSRDALGTLLWPEHDQQQARTYLRHTLWSLKKDMGEKWLQTSRERIGLHVNENVWLDVAVFQEKVTAVARHSHVPGQMCDKCLAQLDEAVALYRDHFLTGFTLTDSPAFDEWQFFIAEDLRQQLAGVLEQLVAEYTARLEYNSAINFARRQLALDSLHEPVHRTLMKLYALGGQQAAAMRQYQECQRLLAEELGVEPEAETNALYEAIRTRQIIPSDKAMGIKPPPSLPAVDRYQIEELLDTGAHGEVFLGQDTQTGKTVIIKRLRSDALVSKKRLIDRFLQEAEALDQLNHPNIVRLLATFELDNQPYLVMEYVSGGSLALRLQKEPQLSLNEVLDIGLELADALARAHHLHIIHRDVKPENVLLAADGTPRLSDFGVARLANREARLTDAGMLMGSPAYMSPEILQGAEPDVRSDIWSFGVLLFEMLAGQRPFLGEQVTAVLISILNDPLPDIRQIRPEVPLAMADLLERMLMKEPAVRLASMRQVAAGLETIRAGHDDLGTAVRPIPFESEDTGIPAAPAGDAPIFVAREQELARLAEMLNTACSGQAQVAFVLGEAGQGKTALLQAFAQRAQKQAPALVVAGGNCNAYTGQGDPYLPFREILALLTADLDGSSLINALQPELSKRVSRLLPETTRILVETAPDLIDTFIPLASFLERTNTARLSAQPWRQQLINRSGNKNSGSDINPEQTALLEQYYRLLRALSRHVSLLLILDDLQWADPGSISLLFHLGRHLADCPVFIVGAYRPDEVAQGQGEEPHPLDRVVNELQRIYGNILIDLGQAEGQIFIDAWLDNEPNHLAGFFRQTLYRQTGGHPLFTIELLRDMRERGDLWQDDEGIWKVQTDINWNTIPARVEGAIGERFNRLDSTLQEMLQVASVEGEEFTAEVVARVLHLDERETVRRLSRELDKVHALVYAVGSRRVGGRRLSRYRFRHILIQHYLYDLLDDVERIYQHEAVGEVLETVYGDQAAELAVQLSRHFEIAQLPQKAAGYLHLAGDQARRAAALPEAIRHYQAALSNWPVEDQAGRARLLRKLGECQWIIGQAEDALETFEAAYELFQELGSLEEAGAVQRLIGRVFWEVGNREKSQIHYQQALTILEALPESVELAWAISSISQMHMLASQHEQAIEWGERALALAGRLEAETVIVHALNNMGTSYLLRNQLERGRSMLKESIRRAENANMLHDACRGYLNLGTCLAGLGHYEEARRTLEELHIFANQAGIILYITSSLIELARLEWLNGRWRAALSRGPQIQEWLDKGQSMAYSHVIASFVFGQQYNELGQPDAAYGILQSTLHIVRGFDELQATVPHLTEMARALSMMGETEETEKVARELLDVLASSSEDQSFIAEALLFILDALPRATEADFPAQDIQIMLANLAGNEVITQVPLRRAALLEGQGMMAEWQGNVDPAIALFREAAALWESVTRPYDQARALKKCGLALAAAGNLKEAYEAFNKGAILLEELANQLDDPATKTIFLQSPLAQAIQKGLQNSKGGR